MLIVAWTLLAAWLIAALAPETSIGRASRRWTIEAPARQMAAVTRGHVLAGSLLIVLVVGGLWFGQGDGAAVFAMAAPEALAWLAVVDVASLAEAALVAVFAVSVMPLRGWRASLVRKPRRMGRRARRSARTSLSAANDDEHRDLRRAA